MPWQGWLTTVVITQQAVTAKKERKTSKDSKSACSGGGAILYPVRVMVRVILNYWLVYGKGFPDQFRVCTSH